MSVNFGYGNYGMNMMSGMQNNGGNNTFQSIAAQYSCPQCYQYGPVPYNFQGHVNPLPRRVTNPNWFTRVFGRIFGF